MLGFLKFEMICGTLCKKIADNCWVLPIYNEQSLKTLVASQFNENKSECRQFREMIENITHNTVQVNERQTRNQQKQHQTMDIILDTIVKVVVLIKQQPLLFSVPYGADSNDRCFVRLSKDHNGI